MCDFQLSSHRRMSSTKQHHVVPLAELVRRKWRAIGERFIVPVASGLIAGESLMGVGVIALKVSGVLAM